MRPLYEEVRRGLYEGIVSSRAEERLRRLWHPCFLMEFHRAQRVSLPMQDEVEEALKEFRRGQPIPAHLQEHVTTYLTVYTLWALPQLKEAAE